MQVFGIQFAPLFIPFRRRLETLSITLTVFVMIILPLLSILLSIYLLLFTKYWWCICLYATWIIADRKTPKYGGRPSKWYKSLTVWKHVGNYFPVQVKLVPGFKVDPEINYLGGAFPHGLLPFSIGVGLTSGYGKVFEKFSIYTGTINGHFYIPFSREILLSMGMCSANSSSISRLLNSPNGRNLFVLSVGGSAEALHFKPDEYRIKLKNRKGFIKLSLKTGAPVIPMFAFGETNIYKHYIFDENSFIRRLQIWIREKTGIYPIISNGRGFFQYTFGILPCRHPVNVVFGKPIQFGLSENPTQAEIDDAHQVFIDALTAIFEEYKYYYEKNPDKCKLIIE